MDTLALQAQLARSLTEASTAIMYLEQTGDFRFEGLTLAQWWTIRANVTAEIDQTVIDSRQGR